MKQLQVQKQQPNISSFKVRMIQQEVDKIQVSKKGHTRKNFTSVSRSMYKDTSLLIDRPVPDSIWLLVTTDICRVN